MSTISVKMTIAWCSLGTILEWYDFSLFGAMAPIISKLFFPSYDSKTAFLAVFFVFSLGFLARPLGAILFGYIGDKFGRKISILISINMMTLATVAIGLLPTYASIGIYAPFVLVTMRIIQGLSSSGEHTGTITYLSEIITEKRYFLLSFVFLGVMLGTLIGSLVGAFVTIIFKHDALYVYGWRLPFLLSIILGGIGLYLKNRIAESPVFKKMQLKHEVYSNPLINLFLNEKSQIILIIGLFCLNTTAFYSIFVYLPAQLTNKSILSGSSSLIINSIGILFMSIAIPYIGLLCDKYGSYFFMKMGAMGFILFTYPLLCLVDKGNCLSILIAQCIFGLFNALFLAPTPIIYTGLFPKSVRYSGVSISMNLSAAIFGGFSPLIMGYLKKSNNQIILQSSYIISAAIISLGCVMVLNKRNILKM